MGAVKAAVNLDPIDPKDERRMKKVLKLMDKRPSESFSAQELKAEEEKMKDVIKKGLEKYASDKEKGKVISQLDKAMFYVN